jgi:hypothetical protein
LTSQVDPAQRDRKTAVPQDCFHFSPFHAVRKVAGTFWNCRNSFRFSTIHSWHQTGVQTDNVRFDLIARHEKSS